MDCLQFKKIYQTTSYQLQTDESLESLRQADRVTSSLQTLPVFNKKWWRIPSMKRNAWQTDARCRALRFSSPPREGETKGEEERRGKGRMSFSLAGLQLVEQQDLPPSKGI